MRAITPEDLKLVAPNGVKPDITTITITAPHSVGYAPPTTQFITTPPPPAPPPGVNPPCLSVAPRANSQLTKANEASGPTDPALANGVVPGNPGTAAFNHSGVTVSYGIDLAQQYASDLAAAGLSHSVVAQLRPFVATLVPVPVGSGLAGVVRKGPRGQPAQDALDANPINPPLSADDVENLFSFFYGRAFDSAINGFQSLTGGDSSFLSLPAAAQSVLTDLTFQYGSLTAPSFPCNMKSAIGSQDWSTLANVLQQMGARGANDAAVLRAAIDANELSSSGACSQ